MIDGALPFAEAADLSFERRWINEDTGRFDKSGNQIRSRQTESPAFMTKAAEDAAMRAITAAEDPRSAAGQLKAALRAAG